MREVVIWLWLVVHVWSLRWIIIKVIADAEGANQLTYPIESLMKPFTPQQIENWNLLSSSIFWGNLKKYQEYLFFAIKENVTHKRL